MQSVTQGIRYEFIGNFARRRASQICMNPFTVILEGLYIQGEYSPGNDNMLGVANFVFVFAVESLSPPYARVSHTD